MGGRVLIVEDDLSQRPLWETIIRRNFDSPRTDWAVSAEEAKRHYETARTTTSPYELIVVDLSLAGNDTGLDFVGHLTNTDGQQHVLLVSSVDEAELRRHLDVVPANLRILSKPLNVPKCERALQSLKQESWPSEQAID